MRRTPTIIGSFEMPSPSRPHNAVPSSCWHRPPPPRRQGSPEDARTTTVDHTLESFAPILPSMLVKISVSHRFVRSGVLLMPNAKRSAGSWSCEGWCESGSRLVLEDAGGLEWVAGE